MPTFDDSAMGQETTTSGGMSRRSVVRAGAVAAWSVPVVQIAAAAPSFAASLISNLSTSTLGTVTRTGTPPRQVNFPVTINNTNNGPTGILEVSMTTDAAVNLTQTAPGGWTVKLGTTSTKVTFQNAGMLSSGSLSATFTVATTANAVRTWTVDITPTTGVGKSFTNVSG